MKPFWLLRMSEAHSHINLQLYQTIDGRRNREQIWGSYFLIEMIKLSYLGLLIVGFLHWGTDMYVSQNIKSCCISLVEFIHKGYNTLNYCRHKPYTGNRYCYDFLALFKMIFLIRLCNKSIKYFIHSFIHSFIHPFIHSSIHSFIHSSIQSFIHSLSIFIFICRWRVCYLLLKYFHDVFVVLFCLFLCSFFCCCCFYFFTSDVIEYD